MRLVHGSDGRLTLKFAVHQATASAAEQASSLADISRKHRLKGLSCIGIQHAGDYKLFQVEAPEVEAAELVEAIRWRIKDLLDYPVEEAVLDTFEVPGQTVGRSQMVNVVAARRAKIQQTVDALGGAGLELEAIDIGELGLRNLVALLPENETGVAILHLGSKSGSIGLYRQGALFLTRQLEIGTEQLAQALTDDSDLVGDSGIPAQATLLLDGIVLELQRSLDYYESHFSQPPINGLVVTPLDRSLPGLLNYFNANMGITARMLDLTALFDFEGEFSETLQAQCLMAIGAGLRHRVEVL